MIPEYAVWRPCDAVETAVAGAAAVEKKQDGPSCLILLVRVWRIRNVQMNRFEAILPSGGYILKDCDGTPDAIIIATGSEVDLAVQAAAEKTGRQEYPRGIDAITNVLQCPEPMTTGNRYCRRCYRSCCC